MRKFFKRWKWQMGRQKTGYLKLLLATSNWPIKFDMYLLKYPTASFIPEHTDKVEAGRHFRINIVLKHAEQGGEFLCPNVYVNTPRLKFFRPDIMKHSVTKIEEGNRILLSIGWVVD